jgi:hypothetical protein
VAGAASAELHEAILNFQRANRHQGLLVDGHLDPGQKGIRVLNHLAAEEWKDPSQSTRFSLSFLMDSVHPANGAVAVISSTNETGVAYAYYQLNPRRFALDIAHKMRIGGSVPGVPSEPFETPSVMSVRSFSGSCRLFELFNNGRTAISRYFFTGTGSDGIGITLTVNFPTDAASTSPTGTIYGGMEFREEGNSTNPPPPVSRLAPRAGTFRV